MWHRRREAASAGLSAAPYSAHHKLYSETVVSSVAPAVALAEIGRFKEAVQYVQRAAKALYEAAKEAFEQVKVTAQRLVELFVEAVTRVLALVDKHKAYLFLMAAVAAGVIALSAALNLWGLVGLEKLAYAASAPFFAGLADAGERAAERFRALGEWYGRWRVDERLIDEVLRAPSAKDKRPYAAFLELFETRRNLPPPFVELRRALARIKGEAERDAAVVAALVLYKALVKNAGAYGEWAELFEWGRGLVKEREFTVKAEEVKRLRETQRRLEKAAEQVRKELNTVLTLYSQVGLYKEPDLVNKLRSLLEVDVKKAEGLAEARSDELSMLRDAGMGTKAYAALLSIARDGVYGHATILLARKGALADVVLLTPRGAYNKAKRVARGRGEAVDPSYSHKEAAGWEDRAASALLRYLLGRSEGADLKFRRAEGRFEVFKAYGGVEARVDVLMVEGQPRSKAGEEELRRFVEEARRKAPDLSGIDKAPQLVEWHATDVSFDKRQIEATTAHLWQAAWYIALFGEPESSRGGANVTKEGIKLNATVYWPREREDQVLRESRWLESLLGWRVESWREMVDAIDWSWVLKRVEELAGELKPWIGPERASDAEREGLVRRMLGELALLTHFAETRRGMDDRRWREERAKRLAEAVEALSGGRIKGEYADRLAKLIIYYTEGQKKYVEKSIDKLAGELAGVSREEVWGIVKFVLSDMYCLARDCARDEAVRKFVAPALELIMLDKAVGGGFNKEEALLRFGEMYVTAIAGDGTVGPDVVKLVVGGELGGGAALLRLAALHLLNQLLPKELAFNVRVYVERNRYYIAATGGDAARLKRLLAVSAPSAGGRYLSPKFDEFVEEARVEVRFGGVRLTKKGRVAADLTISEGGIAVKYNVYLRDDILLQFHSSDRSRVELAARLLRLVGVGAEVRKVGGRGVWQVWATTNRLAAGRKELRDALAEIVRAAMESGWVDADRAESWLEELKRGRVLREGCPKYHVGLSNSGALEVRYRSTNPDNIGRQAQWLRDMGLVEGVHFTVKMPEGGRRGYVNILREGLAYAAWLSVHGEGERQRLAAEFVEYILQRAENEGGDVYRKALEVVEEGRARGSLTVKGLEKKVEVGGREHVVEVIDGDAELEESWSGKTLLRIRITAEVDGVRSDYVMTYGRYGRGNAALGFATARADAPGGMEADAERFSAAVKALTGREPKVYRRSDGSIIEKCDREHLDGFKRFAELADAIERWLEETARRA